MKTIILSKMRRGPEKKQVLKYVINMLKNPYSESSFSKRARLITWLPKSAIIKIMTSLKYDGLVFKKGDQIVSNIFFQRHGNALHLFSIFTEEAFRGTGVSEQAIEKFIAHAKTVKGITKVRIGAGKHPQVVKKYEALRKREEELGITVLQNGWIELDKDKQK